MSGISFGNVANLAIAMVSNIGWINIFVSSDISSNVSAASLVAGVSRWPDDGLTTPLPGGFPGRWPLYWTGMVCRYRPVSECMAYYHWFLN